MILAKNTSNCPTNNHNRQAIRSIYKVENQKLVIELPASFQHTEVEVIVLPVSSEEEEDVPYAIDRGSKAERLGELSKLSVWEDETI